MDATKRWTVVGVIALIIALLWLFWPKPEQKPVPAATPAAAPAPAAPTAAKAEGPATITVLFEYDSAALRAAEGAKLDAFAATASGRASDGLQAVGHADRIGSDAYNMGLSRKRAEAVRSHLVGKGIEAGRVRAEARGEAETATGAACQKLGAESRANRKLVECLQPDRRVVVTLTSRP